MRVSTEYQVDKDSLPMQRKDLDAYARLILGIEDCVPFEDAGYSGKNTDRPAFQEMMSRIRKNEFTHVLVWKIDRISRNLLDFAQMYQEFREHNVTFVSKNEQFDTSSAMGEAMLKIILVFAELERNMTSERVTATMISRAANGQWNGGRIPYGYDYDPEKKVFTINEREAAVIHEMVSDLLKYRSLVHTCRFLNEKGYVTKTGSEWTPTGIWDMTRSVFYIGTYQYNQYSGADRRVLNPKNEWVQVPNHHPAILTQEEHDQIVSTFRTNYRGGAQFGHHLSKTSHIFSGLVYCGKCGSKMVSTPGRKLKNGFRVSNYSCPVRRKAKDCDNPTVNDTVVGEFVFNYLLNMINAQKEFSAIQTPDDLQNRLLQGSPFSDVDSIHPDGLNDYYNVLLRISYHNVKAVKLKPPDIKKKKAVEDPEISRLRKEKDRQQKALVRLQNLYLYSADAMSERDYIVKKSEIVGILDDIDKQLGLLNPSSNGDYVSDPEFMQTISHLIIMKTMNEKPYVCFTTLASSVDPEILHEYFRKLIDSIQIIDGHVASITFRNGLTHRFEYKKSR